MERRSISVLLYREEISFKAVFKKDKAPAGPGKMKSVKKDDSIKTKK